MKNRNFFLIATLAVALVIITSCGSADGDFTGSEYMPDMAHSIAYESNTYNYYGLNQKDPDSVYQKYVMPRKPVANTIARGYTGIVGNAHSDIKEVAFGMPINGHVPYYYENTDADRARASAEIQGNPFGLTDAGLAKGKELYNIYCAICHGEKADGNGYLVRDADPATGDAGGKYPAQPSNLIADEYKASNEGRFYHAIMHGKGVMGHYKDKLSFEERWQVIHWIRKMQFGDDYDPLAMTAEFDSTSVTRAITEVLETGKVSEAALVLDEVFFATGKDVLEPGSKRQLDILANILKENLDVKIQVNGHTDNVGDAQKNMKLSEDRAKAVIEYLTSVGVDGARMTYKGFGDTNPTADNDSPDGRQKNRRTDFNILTD